MMRRYIITIAFILGLLPFSTALFAAGSVNADYEDGPEKMIRIFLNSGEIMDFDVAEIDSITSNSMEQMIWSFGECTSIAVEAIDSVCYISPILRLSTGSLDFGKVAVGNSKTINITMTNTGKYQETYFVMVEGVFSVEGSGQDIKILPGEAKDVVLTFQPTEADYYFSEMRVSSFSVETVCSAYRSQARVWKTTEMRQVFICHPQKWSSRWCCPTTSRKRNLEGSRS